MTQTKNTGTLIIPKIEKIGTLTIENPEGDFETRIKNLSEFNIGDKVTKVLPELKFNNIYHILLNTDDSPIDGLYTNNTFTIIDKNDDKVTVNVDNTDEVVDIRFDEGYTSSWVQILNK